MNSRGVKRISDVAGLRAAQFPQDAGPMAHPIRPESYIKMDNFYTVTVYEKGAEVVRMFDTLLGKEGFSEAWTLLEHDGQAVTCDDFGRAMADANGADLDAFAPWYSQAHAEVRARPSGTKPRRRSLTLTQTVPDTPGQTKKTRPDAHRRRPRRARRLRHPLRLVGEEEDARRRRRRGCFGSRRRRGRSFSPA